MRKTFFAVVTLLTLILLQTRAFAGIMESKIGCKFKGESVSGIKSVRLVQGTLVLNGELEIPLEESRIRCGALGKKVRLDGQALGFQVILKSCSQAAKLEGHIIDSVKSKVGVIECK